MVCKRAYLIPRLPFSIRLPWEGGRSSLPDSFVQKLHNLPDVFWTVRYHPGFFRDTSWLVNRLFLLEWVVRVNLTGCCHIRDGKCVMCYGSKRTACLRYPYTTNRILCQLIFTKNVHFVQNYLHFFRRGGLLKGASWSKRVFSFRRKNGTKKPRQRGESRGFFDEESSKDFHKEALVIVNGHWTMNRWGSPEDPSRCRDFVMWL